MNMLFLSLVAAFLLAALLVADMIGTIEASDLDFDFDLSDISGYDLEVRILDGDDL